MNPIKFKHIIIGLVFAFILILSYCIGEDEYSYDQNQTRFQTTSHNDPSESELEYPYSSIQSRKSTDITRHESLQTKVKGYREETFWGEHTSTAEKVRYMDDDEFKDYLEEVELNDADVYWGAEY